MATNNTYVTEEGGTNVNVIQAGTANVTVSQGESKVVTVVGAGPRGPKGRAGDDLFRPTGSIYSTQNDIQVTGSLFATTVSGDGNGLYNIPTSSIVGLHESVSQSLFPFIGKAEITGSIQLQRPDIIAGLDFFIIRSGSFNAVTVTSDGVLKLGEFEQLPDPVAGGLAYSQANFWVGVE
jgi:hypothetical protein